MSRFNEPLLWLVGAAFVVAAVALSWRQRVGLVFAGMMRRARVVNEP